MYDATGTLICIHPIIDLVDRKLKETDVNYITCIITDLNAIAKL